MQLVECLKCMEDDKWFVEILKWMEEGRGCQIHQEKDVSALSYFIIILMMPYHYRDRVSQ